MMTLRGGFRILEVIAALLAKRRSLRAAGNRVAGALRRPRRPRYHAAPVGAVLAGTHVWAPPVGAGRRLLPPPSSVIAASVRRRARAFAPCPAPRSHAPPSLARCRRA